MAVKLRLSRWGARKKPYYHIIATDSRSPRDGKFLEKVGTYDPMQADVLKKYSVKEERLRYWLSTGAIPTDRVHKILAFLGILEAKIYPLQPKKSAPKAKTLERLEANKKKLNVDVA